MLGGIKSAVYVRSISTGKPGHIPQEQVDGRSSFECEGSFFRDERYDLQQQCHLLAITFIPRHAARGVPGGGKRWDCRC